MFINRTKYELEKYKMEQRIKQLEDIICPNNSHEWVKIGEKVIGYDMLYHQDLTKDIMICSRCKKEM